MKSFNLNEFSLGGTLGHSFMLIFGITLNCLEFHSPLTNNCNKTKGEIKLWLFKIIVFACELESMAMVVTPVIKILFQQNYSYWKEFLNLGKFLLQQSEEQRCSKLVIHCYNPYFWTLVIGGVPFIHHFVTHVNACQHATITQRFTTG